MLIRRRPLGGRTIFATAALTAVALTGGTQPAAADPRPEDNLVAVVSNSPGPGSGNLVQAPVQGSFNFCGNTINVIGVPSPAVGNICEPN
ncbi:MULTISPECIES: chaplin [Streptomyces]|uniref:chaplin n=1 Tax=Streptomyces TaxID=1883 RepID=UPI001E3888A3|nr:MULTISPECIES: chaplin [Streptomyces]UFQ16659.1 chaplin [Streptomyces huasconensis]WCL86260.1 chaplin [Streptomyces sp. JCM 35825]